MRLRLAFWAVMIVFVYGLVMNYRGTSDADMVALAKRHGAPDSAIPKVLQVTHCESGLRPRAVGDGALTDDKWAWSIGPFQIRSRWEEWWKWTDRNPIMLWLSPEYGAESAAHISNNWTNWGAWSCG
jgi:hypothetical protein